MRPLGGEGAGVFIQRPESYLSRRFWNASRAALRSASLSLPSPSVSNLFFASIRWWTGCCRHNELNPGQADWLQKMKVGHFEFSITKITFGTGVNQIGIFAQTVSTDFMVC